MTQAIVAHLLEQAELSVAELAGGCHAETSWVLARAREVLTDAPLPPDPAASTHEPFAHFPSHRY